MVKVELFSNVSNGVQRVFQRSNFFESPGKPRRLLDHNLHGYDIVVSGCDLCSLGFEKDQTCQVWNWWASSLFCLGRTFFPRSLIRWRIHSFRSLAVDYRWCLHPVCLVGRQRICVANWSCRWKRPDTHDLAGMPRLLTRIRLQLC